MAIILKRQLTEDEKLAVLRTHGRICFATGHPIAEGEPLHFDHIKAFSSGGPTDISNIAPMCEKHNKEKGRLPLYDFRVKLQINEFFKIGDRLTLNDELKYFKEKQKIAKYGESVILINKDAINNTIELEINNIHYKFALYTCPNTTWEYFYATLPIDVLSSDDDEDKEIGLQPRYLISNKVFDLFRHFQSHPVLQPSICRLHNGKILVFDGQHKIAGLLWEGRREFECKVYVNPDPRLLNDTNIAAHDKYAQTRFFASIMVGKLGNQFGKDFEDYKYQEDGSVKSEVGFIKFLKGKDQLTNAEVNKRFRNFLYNSILSDDRNKISRLVSSGNRGSDEKPITVDMLEKSLFSSFLYREPVSDDMTTDAYKREFEIENFIKLLNIIDDKSLRDWDAKQRSEPLQIKLNRIFRSKSIMAWSEILHGAICAKLDIQDSEERTKPFYRELTEQDLEKITFVITRLINWKFWDSPPDSEIDRILSDNKSAVKEYLKGKGLTTGYLMGAPE